MPRIFTEGERVILHANKKELNSRKTIQTHIELTYNCGVKIMPSCFPNAASRLL